MRLEPEEEGLQRCSEKGFAFLRLSVSILLTSHERYPLQYGMGEEAAVECDEGFALKMPASGGRVICTEDGSWKSAENQNEFPVCRGS